MGESDHVVKTIAEPKVSQQQSKDEQSPPQTPIVVNVSPRQTTQAYAAEEKKTENLEWKWIPEWTTASSTLALALTTTFLAFFTALLWCSTSALVRKTQKTSRQQERAYLVCGGLVIWNYGRSVGYILSVEWGFCDDGDFKEGDKIDALISTKRKKGGMHVVDVPEVIPPTREQPVFYRYVVHEDANGKPLERPKDKTFFGQIIYKDIFGDKWANPFAFRITAQNTEPVGDVFVDVRQTKP